MESINKKSSKILLGGREYNVSINKNGERIINEMTVDNFLKTISFDDVLSLALLGKKVNAKKVISPQSALIAIEKIKDVN